MQGGKNRVPAVNGKSDDDPHQADGENDEIVADFQDRLLEMTDGVRLLDQLRCLAKIGVRAGAIDERGALTAANDRPRKYRIAGVSSRGQGLSGQG